MTDDILHLLTNNPLFIGSLVILVNIGSKYIINDIPKDVLIFFEKPFVRSVILFALIFSATRDYKIALILTLIFTLMFRYLLNKDSRYCIMNKNVMFNKSVISDRETLLGINDAKPVLPIELDGVNNIINRCKQHGVVVGR